MSPRPSRRTLAVALAVATAGCVADGERDAGAKAAEVLEVPAAVIDVSFSRAPPLRFGAADIAAPSSLLATERDPGTLLVTFVLLPTTEESSGIPLDGLVRAVIDPDAGALLLTSELARDAFVLEGVSASELLARRGATVAGDALAAFPADVSVRVALRTERPSSATTRPSRSTQGPARRDVIEVAFVGRSDREGELESTLELARGEREIAWLGRRELATSRRIAFVVRSPFSKTFGSSTPWLAIAVEIAPEPAPARAIAELRAGLAAESATVRRDGSVLPPGADRASTASELGAFRQRFAAAPRAALAELGRHDDLAVALEAALTLPEDAPPGRDGDRRGHRAPRSAGIASASGPGGRPRGARGPALPDLRTSSRGLLERMFGAAFIPISQTDRFPFPRARLASSREELERLVLLSNLIALESSRPYVRVRAARFLEAHVEGLEGYDPLGSFERRSECVGRLWTRLAPGESRLEDREREIAAPLEALGPPSCSPSRRARRGGVVRALDPSLGRPARPEGRGRRRLEEDRLPRRFRRFRLRAPEHEIRRARPHRHAHRRRATRRSGARGLRPGSTRRASFEASPSTSSSSTGFRSGRGGSRAGLSTWSRRSPLPGGRVRPTACPSTSSAFSVAR